MVKFVTEVESWEMRWVGVEVEFVAGVESWGEETGGHGMDAGLVELVAEVESWGNETNTDAEMVRFEVKVGSLGGRKVVR